MHVNCDAALKFRPGEQQWRMELPGQQVFSVCSVDESRSSITMRARYKDTSRMEDAIGCLVTNSRDQVLDTGYRVELGKTIGECRVSSSRADRRSTGEATKAFPYVPVTTLYICVISSKTRHS